MKTLSIECRNGDTNSLLDLLWGKVFHFTPQSAYQKILSDGKVLNNKDGQLAVHMPQNSFARLMGYVSLFDLRNPKDTQYVLSCYNFLDPWWLEKESDGRKVSKLAYLILHPDYEDKIIQNSQAQGQTGMSISRGEVWIDDHVPIDWIDTVILATNTKPISQTLSGMLRSMDFPDS